MTLTQFTGRRAMPVDELCAKAGRHPYRRVARLTDAIELGLSEASEQAPLVIAGGFFTAGEARKYLMEAHGATAPLF
jgi:folylpolyglutamate synthase/dihydropteroate synthase